MKPILLYLLHIGIYVRFRTIPLDFYYKKILITTATFVKDDIGSFIAKVSLGYLQIAVVTGKKLANLICVVMSQVPFSITRFRSEVKNIRLVGKETLRRHFEKLLDLFFTLRSL